jgi:cytochrome P450
MTETIAPEEFFEYLLKPEGRADPYPFYARLRSLDPVHRIPMGGAWLLSTYDHVADVLRDARFSTDERHSNGYAEDPGKETAFGRIYHSMLLFQDEPDHKRLRDLVQKAFTRRVVEDLRPRVSRLVEGLVDDLIEEGSGDLMADFAYPLPVVVICELLGVPIKDHPFFHEWARHLANRLELQPLRTPETEALGEEATGRLVDYFDDLIARKKHEPAHDLISSLASVEDDGDRLTHDEVLATCILLLIAGHETTANLIGNGVVALMHEPDQWARLVSDPDLARPAVEEMLRFDPPVQIIARIALEDVVIGGRDVEAGSFCGLLLGSANRDEGRFAEADRFAIGREEAPLVAFGGGIHFCLGAPLARLEAQMAVRELASRVPGLEIVGEPERRPSFLIRGFQTLPVSVSVS